MLIFSIIVLCIIAFGITFRLGATQTPVQNEKYDQSRGKTVLLLIIIYAVVILIGLVLVYTLL
jgi:hypothetical protein